MAAPRRKRVLKQRSQAVSAFILIYPEVAETHYPRPPSRGFWADEQTQGAAASELAVSAFFFIYTIAFNTSA